MDASLVGPLINVGAVGVCLVVLALYYVKKDKKYEARVDEIIKAHQSFRGDQTVLEDKFRKEMTDLAEKYRTVMEKFGLTLDALIRLLSKKERD
jgi:hypothetical protein